MPSSPVFLMYWGKRPHARPGRISHAHHIARAGAVYALRFSFAMRGPDVLPLSAWPHARPSGAAQQTQQLFRRVRNAAMAGLLFAVDCRPRGYGRAPKRANAHAAAREAMVLGCNASKRMRAAPLELRWGLAPNPARETSLPDPHLRFAPIPVTSSAPESRCPLPLRNSPAHACRPGRPLAPACRNAHARSSGRAKPSRAR